MREEQKEMSGLVLRESVHNKTVDLEKPEELFGLSNCSDPPVDVDTMCSS